MSSTISIRKFVVGIQPEKCDSQAKGPHLTRHGNLTNIATSSRYHAADFTITPNFSSSFQRYVARPEIPIGTWAS